MRRKTTRQAPTRPSPVLKQSQVDETRKAIAQLLADGKITRQGSGTADDPYRYYPA